MGKLADYRPNVEAGEKIPATLKELSARALKRAESLDLPGRKTEDWKYSFKQLPFKRWETEEPKLTSETDDHLRGSEQHGKGYVIRFNAGSFSIDDHGSSSAISFKKFSQLTDEETRLVGEGVMAQQENNLLATLNTAGWHDGLFIRVCASKEEEQPVLQVVYENPLAMMNHPRLFMLVEEGASAQLVETIAGYGCKQSLLNVVFDIKVESNARLTLVRFSEQADAQHVSNTGIELMRDAQLESHCVGLGARLGRHDLVVRLSQPGAHCDMNGISIATGTEHFDHHTTIDHAAAHCTSNQNYRYIADGSSRLVFNGRIHIHKDAQKTNGYMNNKNLLLSSKAEIDTKPELEIYADDVKCAHGTTIGRIDPAQLYYLQSRGVSSTEAKKMLMAGFIAELSNDIPDVLSGESIRAAIDHTLSQLSDPDV